MGGGGEGYILSGGNSKKILVNSIRTGEVVGILREHKDAVTCMAMEQKLLFTGSDDMTILIWNMNNVKSIYLVGKLEGGHKDCKQFGINCFSYTRHDCFIRNRSAAILFIR